MHVAASAGLGEGTNRFTTRPHDTAVATRLNQTEVRRDRRHRRSIQPGNSCSSPLTVPENCALISALRVLTARQVHLCARCLFSRRALRCKPVSWRVGDELRKSRSSAGVIYRPCHLSLSLSLSASPAGRSVGRGVRCVGDGKYPKFCDQKSYLPMCKSLDEFK